MPVGAYILLGAVALYPIVMFFVLKNVRASRMALADRGRELLQSPHLTESEKRLVGSMLDDAFSWRPMWMIIWHFPGVFYGMARSAMKGEDPLRRSKSFMEKENVREFVKLHSISISAANPLAFAIYTLQVAVVMIVLRSVRAGLKLALASTIALGPSDKNCPRDGSAA